jgi:hypothetical protein
MRKLLFIITTLILLFCVVEKVESEELYSYERLAGKDRFEVAVNVVFVNINLSHSDHFKSEPLNHC